MWSVLKYHSYVGGISKGHKSKSTRSARFVILHDYAVNHLAISAKISLQTVLSRLPRKASNEELAVNKIKRIRILSFITSIVRGSFNMESLAKVKVRVRIICYKYITVVHYTLHIRNNRIGLRDPGNFALFRDILSLRALTN